jgi:hypothetical protein
MEIYRRGILLPLTLLLLVTILGGGRHLASAPAALAQSANEDAMFLPGSGPAELATGSPSHGGLADADPAADFDLDDFGLNGYCVQPISSILQPAGGAAQHYGFRIDPASVAAGALILSSDGFTNDTGQSNDDYYCVIVRAPDVAGSMTITWEYIIAGQLRAITLTIPVFQLDFIGWHGVVGGSAAVCTVGWNEDIMRGRQQMLEWTGSGDPPNDFVVAADWQFTPGVPRLRRWRAVSAGWRVVHRLRLRLRNPGHRRNASPRHHL